VAAPHTDTPRPSWHDLVAALERAERADHSTALRINNDLRRAAAILDAAEPGVPPLERRRIAALALADALAAYRLAGGDREHFAGVVSLRAQIHHTDDVAGSVADRATVARQRVDLELRKHKLSRPDAVDVLAGRLDERAAALERPRARTAPGDVHVHSGADLEPAHGDRYPDAYRDPVFLDAEYTDDD
jgi:hypothetical protein